MKRARRVICHHGSDCPEGPHPFKRNRCLIFTRIDYPDRGRSVAWVSGDYAETCSMAWKSRQVRFVGVPASDLTSERLQRKRHEFDIRKPTYYGGGFWPRVCIPALPEADRLLQLVCRFRQSAQTDLRDMIRLFESFGGFNGPRP